MGELRDRSAPTAGTTDFGAASWRQGPAYVPMSWMRPSRPAQVRDGDGLAARRIAPAGV